jgi:hypothetical protein
VYLPLEQHRIDRLTLLVHTAGDPLAAADPVRSIVRSLDARLPIASTRTMQTLYEDGALGIQRYRAETGLSSLTSGGRSEAASGRGGGPPRL